MSPLPTTHSMRFNSLRVFQCSSVHTSSQRSKPPVQWWETKTWSKHITKESRKENFHCSMSRRFICSSVASISIESKKFLRATTLADSLCKHDYSPNPVTSSAKQANKFSAKEMLDVSWSLPPKPERSELYMLVESMPTPSAASGLNIFISIAYIKQKYYIYMHPFR